MIDQVQSNDYGYFKRQITLKYVTSVVYDCLCFKVDLYQ
jgi:hypothetical protein